MTDEVPHGRQANCILYLPLKLYLHAVNSVGPKKNDRMVVSNKLRRKRACVFVFVFVCVCVFCSMVLSGYIPVETIGEGSWYKLLGFEYVAHFFLYI